MRLLFSNWNCSLEGLFSFCDASPKLIVGTVKKLSLTFFALSLKLNCWTWGLTYSRDALLLHLPWIIILDECMCCRNSNIAKLVRIKCVPTLKASKPSFAFPMIVTTVFKWADTSIDQMCSSLPTPVLKTSMSVSNPVFGYNSIQRNIAAQAFTRKISFFNVCWVMVAYFCLFFWFTKVIVTDNAYGIKCSHSFNLRVSILFWKKQISWTVSFLVFLLHVTLVYLH